MLYFQNFTSANSTTNNSNNDIDAFQIVFTFFMALITLYLTILYIKSKSFHTYSCYNIIFMSIIILINCIILFIPQNFGNDGEYEGWEYIVALFRNFFGKLILSVLSMQVIVLYIGIIHTEYYYSHEKSIFIIGFFACVIVSGVLSAIYSSIRWLKDKNGNYIYDENDDDDLLDGNTDSAARKTARRTLEIIFCSILFVANVLCLIVVISHISKKSKEAKAGLIEDLGYKNQLVRFSFILTINIIAILVFGILINYEILGKYDEYIFLVVCFIIDLVYSINKTVYTETKKLFCTKEQYNERDGSFSLKKQSTFGDELYDMEDYDE